VVAYAASASGVSELLLALLKPDGAFQLIGRVKTGWSRAENADLLRRLAPLACDDVAVVTLLQCLSIYAPAECATDSELAAQARAAERLETP